MATKGYIVVVAVFLSIELVSALKPFQMFLKVNKTECPAPGYDGEVTPCYSFYDGSLIDASECGTKRTTKHCCLFECTCVMKGAGNTKLKIPKEYTRAELLKNFPLEKTGPTSSRLKGCVPKRKPSQKPKPDSKKPAKTKPTPKRPAKATAKPKPGPSKKPRRNTPATKSTARRTRKPTAKPTKPKPRRSSPKPTTKPKPARRTRKPAGKPIPTRKTSKPTTKPKPPRRIKKPTKKPVRRTTRKPSRPGATKKPCKQAKTTKPSFSFLFASRFAQILNRVGFQAEVVRRDDDSC